jgi:hypothetical protein
MVMAFSSSPSSSRALALPYWAVAESAYSTDTFNSESKCVSFASGANGLRRSFSAAAIVDSKLIISLLDEVRDEHEKASHKNMASLVLEKAMVMEEYMMTRHE